MRRITLLIAVLAFAAGLLAGLSQTHRVSYERGFSDGAWLDR